MKTAYKSAFVAVSVVVLSWFIPWLYSLALPEGYSDPFVAYSPLSDSFIVSERAGTDEFRIFDIDSAGNSSGRLYSREERDSLLPHIYFNQLVGRQQLPDSLGGIELTVAEFKRGQWVFNSSPRDLNKRKPRVYMIMEAMPPRFELEDAKEVFRMDSEIEFVRMADNLVNERRGSRFNDALVSRGFAFPAHDLNANVTTRKPYDEGYLMVDAVGAVFHMKMQGGRPYVVKVSSADSVHAENVFILENTDRRHLGLVTDSNHKLYVLERDGYRLIELPVGHVNPRDEKLTVMKNLFNWVVKVSGREGSRWVAIDADDYHLLGEYSVSYPESTVQTVSEYLFPFELSFTSVNDCYAYPRIWSVSWKAVFLNLVLAVALFMLLRQSSVRFRRVADLVTVVFGIFSFIPFLLLKD